MAVLSGKSGNVLIAGTGVLELRNWKWDRKNDNKAYASNSTAGTRKRVAGVKDSSGSFQMLDNPASNAPALTEGTTATLQLKLDGTTVYCTTLPIIVDSIACAVDLDSGDLIAYDVNFSTNGAWTL